MSSGELIDERPVFLIGRSRRSRPGQARDRPPCRLARPAFVPDQIGGVRQAGAMVPGNAMKKNGLPALVRQEVSRLTHLLDGCLRAPHRNDNPFHTRISHDLRLRDVLGIVAIDRGQCHNGLDSLAGDDRTQCVGSLPRAADQTMRNDRSNPFLARHGPMPLHCRERHERQRRYRSHRQRQPGRTCHKANAPIHATRPPEPRTLPRRGF